MINLEHQNNDFEEDSIYAYKELNINFLDTDEGREYAISNFEANKMIQELVEKEIEVDEEEHKLVFPNPYRNDKYAIEYKKRYTRKIDIFEKSILDKETGVGMFSAVCMEAGLGKSYHANRIIGNHLNEFLTEREPRNFLLVKRFNSEIEEAVRSIPILPNDTRVLGITSDNWSEEWVNKLEDLEKFRVIVISHKRYMDLCLNDEFRMAFTKGRHTLIIDEKPIFPNYSFSEKIYKEVQQVVPPQLDSEFIKISSPFLEAIRKQRSLYDANKCPVVKDIGNLEDLKVFQKKIEINKNSITNISKIYDYIDTLRVIGASKNIFYHGQRLVTSNTNHRLWGLKNNIILDASADIDYTYRISPWIKLSVQKGIIKHKNSIVYRVNYNSSKTSINKRKEEYFDKVCELIVERKKIGMKVLIVCLKTHEKDLLNALEKRDFDSIGVGNDYKDEEIAINWFGNLIGKNLYKDFEQCWVVGTQHLPMETYPVQYLQYSGVEALEEDVIQIEKGRFKNNKYKSLQISYLASEIYQSIKRIQRNEKPNAEFYIVNNDEDVFEMAIKKLNGVRRGGLIELNIEKNDKRKMGKDNKIVELVEYLKNLPKGIHKKKDIREKFGIHPSNFSRYLNPNNLEIKALIDAGIIEIQKQKVIKF
ncbi:hypothetical protein ACIQZI_13260 [Peribacillus sp. NPDC096379]|uniref:hypothetical protein n=1 Tax=Peribacillus sp. NPDC096379 TaxID=3364393 RepID=UPI003823C2B2